MKRTATTLALLAGFGGGCMTADRGENQAGKFGGVTRPATIPGVQGPTGEPVAMTTARGAMPSTDKKAPVQPAGGKAAAGGTVVRAYLPGSAVVQNDPGVVQVNGGGIVPVPGMGPPGAVAAVGALVPPYRAPAAMGRTSVFFREPAGMTITWQLPTGGFNDEGSGLTTPKDYNFVQGQVYRLRLSRIQQHPGKVFYPTLEVAPATPRTVTFLAHASVPVTFEDTDFRWALDGNLVVKVFYLPDPGAQVDGPDAGVGVITTRVAPGEDPVAEAQRKGTILAIVRLGNIDLENRSSPAMNAPPGGLMAPPPGLVVPQPGTVVPQPIPAPPGAGAAIPTPLAPAAPAARPLAIPTAPSGTTPPASLPVSIPGRPAGR